MVHNLNSKRNEAKCGKCKTFDLNKYYNFISAPLTSPKWTFNQHMERKFCHLQPWANQLKHPWEKPPWPIERKLHATKLKPPFPLGSFNKVNPHLARKSLIAILRSLVRFWSSFKSGKWVFSILISFNFEWILWWVVLWRKFWSLMI